MCTRFFPPPNYDYYFVSPPRAGAKLLFGGKPLSGHSIPEVYGAVEPTAVFVPLQQALLPEHFGEVTKEVFGPFQVRLRAPLRRRAAA